jgi:hypothetical protein
MWRRNEEASLQSVRIEPERAEGVRMVNFAPMLRTILLVLALPTIGPAFAQVHPGRYASPGTHLLVVNGQWSTMDPAVLNDQRSVAFASEAARIADHLHRVADRLAERTAPTLVEGPSQRRLALLDTLQAYADRGRFPLNNTVPGRTPVFIDEQGTACAVGQLMIGSGHEALAEQIRKEMNLAYVYDIDLPEVAVWARDHGFTIDELAWIQPTYHFERIRDPSVLAAFDLANGDRVEVQAPTSTDAPKKLRLVRKNGQGEKVLATFPLLSAVQAMEFNGQVYVAGMPPAKGPAAEVYHWNGTSLKALDPFPGRMVIGSIYMQNGMLHVVGYELGDPQPQERYLTEDGEWKVI